MAYTKVGPWTNGASPYINATNLDHIEDGIADAHTAIDTINSSSTDTTAKLAEIISPLDYDAAGDGVTDDATAWQSAINAAAAIGGTAVIDGGGKQYAIGSSLSLIDKGAIEIRNARFIAIGTWVDATPFFDLRHVSDVEGANFYSVHIDCAGLCSGLYFIRTLYSRMVDCEIKHFDTYGIKSETKATELFFERVNVRQWDWADSERENFANRTARGFDLQTADFMMTSCVANYCLDPLYLDNFYNGQIIGCHFYNGAATSGTDGSERNIYVGPNANNVIFGNNYIDNGEFRIVGNFNHILTGTLFAKSANGTNTKSLALEATVADEDAKGLIVTGSIFSGTTTMLSFDTSGDGTWLEPYDLVWLANRKADGSLAWRWMNLGSRFYQDGLDTYIQTDQIQLDNYSSSIAEIRTNKALRLSADYDAANSAGATEVLLATDGTDKWKVTGSGVLEPINDQGQWLGSSTARILATWTDRVMLTDGITQPSAIAGFGQLFIDSSDGSLKFRFGDGSIVLIAENPA
jgi:hypothetical protein